jgi:glutathione S-transferase
MTKPVLWQIKVSHYSEKVRWALDFKGVEHERRSPPPGAHMAIALAKSRGASKTFPLLDLDGRTYSDSTDIVAALEERRPEPPLYPADPQQRARALELEEFFDEEVGPYTRLLAWHEIVNHRPTAERLIESGMAGPAVAARYTAPVAAQFLQLRYGVKSDDAAREAREKIDAGFDRLEAELGDGEYLVGDQFSVADLTAAALYYPTVLPAEGPQLPDPPPSYVALRAEIQDRPAFAYVERMYRLHRKIRPSTAASTASARRNGPVEGVSGA